LPFPLSDPWGFRRAIVPVFKQEAVGVTGVGTAFHIGGKGKFLTANHNVRTQQCTSADIGETPISGAIAQRILLLLPFGLAFGTTKLPDNSMVTVARVSSPLVGVDDPIESLKGHDAMEAIDIATLDTDLPPTVAIETLPLCLRGAIPMRTRLPIPHR
jgi:hypothetical protein